MEYIESPTGFVPGRHPRPKSVFLAGGITGCPNWQQDMVRLLRETNMILLNPRRENFPIDDPGAAQKQIEWEYWHLRRADAILFWFPCETICPIVLYELGAWSMTSGVFAARKPIFVGVHPEYQRRRDVEIQTALERPDVRIVNTLPDLAVQVRMWSVQAVYQQSNHEYPEEDHG